MKNNIIPEILGLRGWSRRRAPTCLQSRLYNNQVQFLKEWIEGQSTRVRWNTVPSRKEQEEVEDHPKARWDNENGTLCSLILLSNSFLKGSGIWAIGIARRRTVTSNVDHLYKMPAWWQGKNSSIVSRNQADQPRSKEVKTYYANYVKFEAYFPEGIYKIILPRLATMQ